MKKYYTITAFITNKSYTTHTIMLNLPPPPKKRTVSKRKNTFRKSSTKGKRLWIVAPATYSGKCSSLANS
jgi:hypothetical protein